MTTSKIDLAGRLSVDIERLSSETRTALEALHRRYSYLRDQDVYVLFSGGLDTSFLAHFFHHILRARVTAVHVNVGSIVHGLPFSDGLIARRAEMLGLRYESIDGTPHLEPLLLSAVRAEAQLFRGHHPASSLSRVAIAKAIAALARPARPAAIVHGSDRHQNNPFRFFNAFKAFGDPSTEVLAPHLDESFSRKHAAEYLDWLGLPLTPDGSAQVSSSDDNIFGLEAEDASIDDPTTVFDIEDLLDRLARVGHSGATLDWVQLEFTDGVPTSVTINDVRTDGVPIRLLDILNGAMLPHRIGIFDYYEPRPQGREAREIHCAPGFALMVLARHLLRRSMLPPLQNRRIERLSSSWSEFVMGANLWTHDLRKRADRAFESLSLGLSGRVRLRVGYKYVDLPSVHPATISYATRESVTSEQLVRLFDALHSDTPTFEADADRDGLCAIAAAMDVMIERTYRFFSPPVDEHSELLQCDHDSR